MITERDRDQLKRTIDTEAHPGHWVWTGRTNTFGSPVLPGHAQMLVSAAGVVYHAFKHRVMPNSFERQCEHVLCVKPTCWSETPRAPKERRKREPGQPHYGGPALKEECIRGHNMAETRKRTASSGRAYCSRCAKEKAAERWQAKKDSGEWQPKGRLREYCKREHLMAETRKRWPSGVSYCSACEDMKAAQRAAKVQARQAERRQTEPHLFPIDVLRMHYRPGLTAADARELIWRLFPQTTPDSCAKALRKVKQENGEATEKRAGVAAAVRDVYQPGMTLDDVRAEVWKTIPEASAYGIGRALLRYRKNAV